MFNRTLALSFILTAPSCGKRGNAHREAAVAIVRAVAQGRMLGAIDGASEVAIVEAGARWLLTPLSGSTQHTISPWIAWHGRLMVLSMGLLMPPVVLIARFFKVTPRQDWPHQLDNPFWFVTHRRWGHAIGLLLIAGLTCALTAVSWQIQWSSPHTALGWTVITLVFVQMVSAWLRGTHGGPVDPFTRKRRPPHEWPGDHFSMTARRIVFEYVHKYAGYALLILTLVAIPTGLVAADSPHWMPIVMGVWWLFVLCIFLWLQRAGRCVDTYQAIWGPDPSLPGNRKRHPIGLGISRNKSDFAPMKRK